MDLDISALRVYPESESLDMPFRHKEKELLLRIELHEMLQLKQQEHTAQAKRPAAVFTLLIGSVLVEATALDTVSTVIEQFAGRIGANSASVSITQDGQDLPKEATLSQLGISATSKLDCRLQGYQVYVKLLSGKALTLNVEGSDTIGNCKELLWRREGFPPEQQRLIFAGAQLDDARTLAECGVEAESSLHLVLHVGPGGSCDKISGRQGFEVFSDKIVFEDGSSWNFDGGWERPPANSDDEQTRKMLSFSSKGELLSFLESSRIKFLRQRLEQVQRKTRVDPRVG
ncbi:ubq-1 [Symbiodinium sp. CCMP2592]|nr:ubq-1 [Symbiodinium sp. CCMP2592]